MKKLFVERNFILLALGAFLFFSVGAVLTVVFPPYADETLIKSPVKLHELTEQEKRGRAIYQSMGCVYCHTQQIRTLESDKKRYGWRMVDAAESEAWEYVNDKPQFLGTKRTGPDLYRVGGKYSSEWHWSHFKDPRNMAERFVKDGRNYRTVSIMPSFKFLGDKKIKDLTAYVQTLGRNKNWRKDKNGVPLNDYEE